MSNFTFKSLLTVATVLGTLGTASTAFAATQNSASTSATASAKIITPIAIAKTADLNFGDVVTGATTGIVTVTTAGARSSSGGATLGNNTGVAASAFAVTGQASETYAITLPATAVTLSSGSNTMTVDTFTSSLGTTSSIGAGPLNVGGNLNVGANQATGAYTGTFNVSVNYN